MYNDLSYNTLLFCCVCVLLDGTRDQIHVTFRTESCIHKRNVVKTNSVYTHPLCIKHVKICDSFIANARSNKFQMSVST